VPRLRRESVVMAVMAVPVEQVRMHLGAAVQRRGAEPAEQPKDVARAARAQRAADAPQPERAGDSVPVVGAPTPAAEA
jgi:hypothetical protein